MYDIILTFLTAFTITYVAIPSIIRISIEKRLMDAPGERSSHSKSIPTLGGFGIFGGLICSMLYWTPFQVFNGLQYILCALVIMFLVGAKDDIIPLAPHKKLLGQLFAAAILVLKADVRLTSFYGIFGINDLPYWISVAFSIFTLIVINNAFNLIDGINGLAGSITCVISVTFGLWFFRVDQLALAVLAFSLTGALVAFLKYNFSPARIFMGDTGSLIVGLISSILAIKFIELNRTLPPEIALKSIPALAVGIMIIPLFDTLRVFTLRALAGRSPFSPDRNHIHHLLIDCGLSHMAATTVLIFVNILYICFVFYFQNLGSLELLLLLLTSGVIASQLLSYTRNKRRAVVAKA